MALLLEPLGVDVLAGLDSLERLAREVDAVAQSFEVPSPPQSGTTLRWVRGAVAARIEDDELVGLAAAEGWDVTPDVIRSVRELSQLEGVQRHLRAFGGVTLDALRADLAAVSLAERVLPAALERCRVANQTWPKDIRRSIRQVDVDRAIAGLRRRRGSRQAEDTRELVLRHAATTARDLPARDLIARLEKVQGLLAARKAYENLVSERPEWWRWLGPAVRFRFRTDRRDALDWAIDARDTGTVSATSLELLADDTARAVMERWLATGPLGSFGPVLVPPNSSAERIAEGLRAVSMRVDLAELRALEAWYANGIELFDRVAAAMDRGRSDSKLRTALDDLTGQPSLPFGPVDTSRAAYREIQSMLHAEVNARIERTHYSEHATANEYLVGVISVIAALERQLRERVRAMPAARGALVIAIAGRTKSGKTTLRKALTHEAGRTGIGRGAHRTTRQTSAFEIGSVTYLDTPGVAAKDDDFDAEQARAACDMADAVIWNYADTLRDEEVRELQRLLQSGKPLLVVINVKERVDTPGRLQLFTERPERAFGSSVGHAARIEQVFGTVGVVRPTVLVVHSGAAHESLSAEDQRLGGTRLQREPVGRA